MPSQRSAAGAAVEFRQVRFRYADRIAVDTLDLAIGSGEAVALVGRSGAGKSTVLKMVNGLLMPQNGAVLVDGRETRQWDTIQLRRRTGYVLQEIALFPHLTVEQNVTLIPRLEGWSTARQRSRAAELLELVGLPATEFATRWPHELSGGQRQRVGVARALAADPPVLLMDEPFGALDPITRAELQREFQRIHHELKKTVVMVTHDIREAMALNDRVGVLEEGRLIICDTPAVVSRSTDPHVRRFLDAVPPGPFGA